MILVSFKLFDLRFSLADSREKKIKKQLKNCTVKSSKNKQLKASHHHTHCSLVMWMVLNAVTCMGMFQILSVQEQYI